jgi:DNA polymerase elongation subunit (family B)
MKFYTRCDKFNGYYNIRGYENGKQFQEQHKVEHSHFELCSKNVDSPYRSLDGRKVAKRFFKTRGHMDQAKQDIAETANREYYGMELSLYPFINELYPNTIEYDSRHIRVANIDIEIAADDGFPDIQEALKPITAITMCYDNFYYVYGIGDYTNTRDDVLYKKYKDERSLIIGFVEDWRKINPDVVTGWNVEGFDIPYIVNRFERVAGRSVTDRLSPWGIIFDKTITKKGLYGDETTFVKDIIGVTVLDYLVLYKKFTYKGQENYRLDTIANVELGEKKLDYSEYGSLLNLYKHDYQKFIDYNIKDVELVERLDEKLGLFELVYALAYDAKVNFADSLTSVKMWDVIIHNHLIKQNIVVPGKPLHVDKGEKIKGGYVKQPKPGMYNWVCSFDLDSLYPHLIMQYNISPDTFMGHIGKSVTVDSILFGSEEMKEIQQRLDETNCCMAASGFVFSKNKQGFLAELMETMYKDRVRYKNMMKESSNKYKETGDEKYKLDITRYHNMQMAKKIQLNSAYGALANEWFRWFNNSYAESITLSGQLAIRWIQEKLNSYLNKVLGTNNEDFIIASDTDSVYVVFDKLVESTFGDLSEVPKKKVVNFLDKVCDQKIQPFIEKTYQELADHTRAHSQKMNMKRECIADKAIWTAKKRYILNVYINENEVYDTPKLKMMGIEAIKSSTPTACRDYITETLRLIMDTDEEQVKKYIAKVKREYPSLSFDEVAFPRSVNNVKKYRDRTTIYKKGTPIAVRGALLYNKTIEDLDLGKIYEPINDGDKVKFSYLKMPNPIKDNVVSCPSGLPSEFDIEKYIDYKIQFEKGYLSPMKAILDAIGWEHEQRNTLPFL